MAKKVMPIDQLPAYLKKANATKYKNHGTNVHEYRTESGFKLLVKVEGSQASVHIAKCDC